MCRVHRLLPDPGPVGVTAIDKRPVEGRVKVLPLGLYADVQADRANHGGEDQAVYAYAQEDADFWSAELGYEVTPGLFGENLRTGGIEVSTAVVGERWRVGTATLEVTHPRSPCATFQRRLGEPRWVRRFTAANRPGAYLRVVEPGELGVGDAVDVVHRPSHGVTVADWFAAWTRRGEDHEEVAGLARRLTAAAEDGELELSADLRDRTARALDAAVG